MTVAETVAPLVRAVFGREAPVAIRGWDGSRSGPANAQWALKINNRRGLRRLLWAPNELGFARAYVSGDIEIQGDLLEGMSVLEQISDPMNGPGVRIDTETKRALMKTAVRLGVMDCPRSRRPRRSSPPAVLGTTNDAMPPRSATTMTSATTSTAWYWASR